MLHLLPLNPTLVLCHKSIEIDLLWPDLNALNSNASIVDKKSVINTKKEKIRERPYIKFGVMIGNSFSLSLYLK